MNIQNTIYKNPPHPSGKHHSGWDWTGEISNLERIWLIEQVDVELALPVVEVREHQALDHVRNLGQINRGI